MSQPDITSLTVNDTSVQPVPTGTVPYIRKTERPLFAWDAHDADGQALTFSISCSWYGRRDSNGAPTITPVTMFSASGLGLPHYRPKQNEALAYLDPDDSGGDYYIEVTATDTEAQSVTASGFFRVNQPPGVPTGLRVI